MEKLDTLIKTIENVKQDVEYASKKARSPKSKRQHKQSIIFWTDIQDSLIELKELKEKKP